MFVYLFYTVAWFFVLFFMAAIKDLAVKLQYIGYLLFVRSKPFFNSRLIHIVGFVADNRQMELEEEQFYALVGIDMQHRHNIEAVPAIIALAYVASVTENL